jgi:hypothetical protein
MSPQAKVLWMRYFGPWPKSKMQREETVTARPKQLMSYLVVDSCGPGLSICSGGYKCGPLPMTGGRKHRD